MTTTAEPRGTRRAKGFKASKVNDVQGFEKASKLKPKRGHVGRKQKEERPRTATRSQAER